MSVANLNEDVRLAIREMHQAITHVTCTAEKLSGGGQNFLAWKKEMMLYFKEAELWRIVTEEVQLEDAEWHKKNNKALRDIFNTCESKARELILEEDYAKNAWDALVKHYSSKNSKTVNQLLDDWDLVKMGKESCQQYIARVKLLARQLNQVGEGVSKQRMLNKLLKGLPKEYAALRSSFRTHEELTDNKVIDAILAEEGEIAESRREEERERERMKEDASKGRKRERSRSPQPDSCKQCGKRGHMKNQCWELLNCEVCGKLGHGKNVCWVLYPEKRRNRLPVPQQNLSFQQNQNLQNIQNGRFNQQRMQVQQRQKHTAQFAIQQIPGQGYEYQMPYQYQLPVQHQPQPQHAYLQSDQTQSQALIPSTNESNPGAPYPEAPK